MVQQTELLQSLNMLIVWPVRWPFYNNNNNNSLFRTEYRYISGLVTIAYRYKNIH